MRTKLQIRDGMPSRLSKSSSRLLHPLSTVEREALKVIANYRTRERTTRARERTTAAAAADSFSDDADAVVGATPTEQPPLCRGVRHSTVAHGAFLTPQYRSDTTGWDTVVSQAVHRATVFANFGGDLPKSVHGIILCKPSGARPTGLAAHLLKFVRWAITGPEQCGTTAAVLCAVAIQRPPDTDAQMCEYLPAITRCVTFLYGNHTAFLSYVDSDDGKTKEGVFRCPHCTTTSSRSTSTRCMSCQTVQHAIRRLIRRPTSSSITRNLAAKIRKGGVLSVLTDLATRLDQAEDNIAEKSALIKEQNETICSLRADLERLAETDTLSTTVAEDEAEADAARATLLAAQSVLLSDLTPSKNPPSLPPEPTRVLDDVLPPNSLGRLMWDANLRNLESEVRTGNKKGARYSVEIHQIALMILSKAGATCYTKLSAAMPCLPTLRRIQMIKGNYPVGETGPLTSRMETMNHLMDGTESKDPKWDRVGVLSFDEMHVGE